MLTKLEHFMKTLEKFTMGRSNLDAFLNSQKFVMGKSELVFHIKRNRKFLYMFFSISKNHLHHLL